MDAQRSSTHRRSDGVRIAYGACGRGSPALSASRTRRSATARSSGDRSRASTMQLCRNRQVITFDPRWHWHVRPGRRRFSRSRRAVLDLEAVVDRLESRCVRALGHLALAGPMAVSYAAHQPDRVSHLVLDDAFASARATLRSAQMRALTSFAGATGRPFTEHMGTFLRWSWRRGCAPLRRIHAVLRDVTTREAIRDVAGVRRT